MTSMTPESTTEPSGTARALSTIGGAFLGLFSLGFLVGYAKTAMVHGTPGLKDAALLAVGLGLLALAFVLLRKGIGRPRIAKTPKMREYQIVLIALCAMGAVIGVLVQIDASGSGFSGLGYDMPISRPLAIGLLAIQPLLAFLYWRWHRAADELEQAAYTFGALLSLYAYFFASTVWWIGWRGGLMGEPDGYAIFWMVMVVWTFGWIWKRYR